MIDKLWVYWNEWWNELLWSEIMKWNKLSWNELSWNNEMSESESLLVSAGGIALSFNVGNLLTNGLLKTLINSWKCYQLFLKH